MLGGREPASAEVVAICRDLVAAVTTTQDPRCPVDKRQECYKVTGSPLQTLVPPENCTDGNKASPSL